MANLLAVTQHSTRMQLRPPHPVASELGASTHTVCIAQVRRLTAAAIRISFSPQKRITEAMSEVPGAS